MCIFLLCRRRHTRCALVTGVQACALPISTLDQILSEPGVRTFCCGAMQEAAAIGSAIGCPIDEEPEARLAMAERLGAFRTSMLQDVEAGRPIELDAIVRSEQRGVG